MRWCCQQTCDAYGFRRAGRKDEGFRYPGCLPALRPQSSRQALCSSPGAPNQGANGGEETGSPPRYFLRGGVAATRQSRRVEFNITFIGSVTSIFLPVKTPLLPAENFAAVLGARKAVNDEFLRRTALLARWPGRTRRTLCDGDFWRGGRS